MKKLRIILLAVFLALPSFAFGAQCIPPETAVDQVKIEVAGSRVLEVIEGMEAQDWIDGTKSKAQVDKLVVMEIPGEQVLLVLASYRNCYIGYAFVDRKEHLRLKLRVKNA